MNFNHPINIDMEYTNTMVYIKNELSTSDNDVVIMTSI